MGGGLLASIRPGTAFVFEQKRMPDGCLAAEPRAGQHHCQNTHLKGIEINGLEEFSDYKRFDSVVEGYKLGTPATATTPAKPNRRKADVDVIGV